MGGLFWLWPAITLAAPLLPPAASSLSARPIPPAASRPAPPAAPDTFGYALSVPLQPHRRRLPAGGRYGCDACAKRFDKLKQYNAHLASRGHRSVLAEEGDVWRAYEASGDAFYHPAVERAHATRAWNVDAFLDGLPGRSRSSVGRVLGGADAGGQLSPSLMLSDLPPPRRAELWRYLRGVSPSLAAMVSELPPRYARVKELLESAEVFLRVERLIRRARRRSEGGFTDVYDVGCGHGLVAMLVACGYPGMRVLAVDAEPRESFAAHRDSFARVGADLSNLTFEAGDLSSLGSNLSRREGRGGANGRGLVISVHGCKSLTHESIEFAQSRGWAWLAVPCCLQTENHLGTEAKVKLTDETRFAFLCGALAGRYSAETVDGIDPRITARGIVLSLSQ